MTEPAKTAPTAPAATTPKTATSPKTATTPKSGSPKAVKSPTKLPTETTVTTIPAGSGNPDTDEDYYTRPDFIYGGPFIAVKLPSPFLDISTPMNVPQQGTFRKSFAYFSLKERLPVILTKIIDHLSRDGPKIMSQNSATQDDINKFMQTVTKLKNDLMTNKEYEPFKIDTPEAKKWNRWIEALDNKKYFLNNWMFTECYVYRKLKEGCELTDRLEDFDYFEDQKNRAFTNNEELMCVVADRVVTMVVKTTEEENDKRKADFITLLKICLWANKCDLSLSLGSEVNLIQSAKDETERNRLNPPPVPPAKGKKKKKKGPPPGPKVISPDPFQMILDYKDKVVADNCNKIVDTVVKKSEKMKLNIAAVEEASVYKAACDCNKMAKTAKVPICPPPPVPEGEEPPPPVDLTVTRIPCPSKMTIPTAVYFDIVCDNAGYELFADLCLAHFLVAQEIVQKVRFHVKNMPWFISDVTTKDFHYLIEGCMNSQFSAPSSTGATEGENNEPKVVTAENLRALGEQWFKYVDEGIFILLAEDFWTYPHCYQEMKKLDPFLYRKLQTGIACMFKGDLNYRKLVGDVKLNPYIKLQAAIGTFKPTSIIAVRTVKAETVCGMGKKGNKFDVISNMDPKWMQTGNYGVIQFAPKGEPLKSYGQPCLDYCTTCFGVICPEQFDI